MASDVPDWPVLPGFPADFRFSERVQTLDRPVTAATGGAVPPIAVAWNCFNDVHAVLLRIPNFTCMQFEQAAGRTGGVAHIDAVRRPSPGTARGAPGRPPARLAAAATTTAPLRA
jgi:hypothetical protein